MPVKTKDTLDLPKTDSVVEQINSEHQVRIMRMGSYRTADVEVIPTGAVTLDVALGCGGFPRGRIIEIYGPESCGKTTLALSMLGEAMRFGEVAYIDAEHALDPKYVRGCGINIDDVFIFQPDSAEKAFEVIIALAKSGLFSFIVLDSVAALPPQAELDGDMGEAHMGLFARLMSQALRKMTSTLLNTKTTVLMINQLREKIGVVWGSNETTTGGKALKFYASIRMDLRPGEKHGPKGEGTGRDVKIKVVKNKVGTPFRECELTIDYGTGINSQASLLDAAADLKVLKKSGGWLSFGDINLGNGQEKQLAFLQDHPQVHEDIAQAVYATIKDRAQGSITTSPGENEVL